MKDKKLGFLGLGSIGFPMCYGLSQSGYRLVLPTYRREVDQETGFSSLCLDEKTKTALIDEMLEKGAVGADSLREMTEMCDVFLISMPTSKEVEELVLSPEGILANAKPGTLVIDLTSADPSSTRKLSKMLEEKGIDMIDAPVSGGIAGAIKQTLTIMAGGKPEIFKMCKPILNVIGNPEKVMYIGPSGAGNTIKVANNFLSACCTAATTEAVMVAVKAGIDPRKAIEVIQSSGGNNDAASNKYPNLVFEGKDFNFTLSLMCKDVNLFNQTARVLQVPTLISNLVHQIWSIPVAEGGGSQDCKSLINLYEKWCGVEVYNINHKDN